jgi:tRNA G26 N,N-dimethylase Trm1
MLHDTVIIKLHALAITCADEHVLTCNYIHKMACNFMAMHITSEYPVQHERRDVTVAAAVTMAAAASANQVFIIG